MNKLRFLIIAFLLINFFASGQGNSSVEIFQGRGVFKSRKILDLSYSNLQSVPIEASNPEIETLILDNNQIGELPSWIGNMKNLKVLSVRNNNLTEVNNALSGCENLEQIYLSGNRNLFVLPSLSGNNKLELIDVADTRITDVPGWVRTMDSLYYFKFSKP